ncbi:protein phosphatase [Salix suchowensis]|nr:protein phosphatase [Salix suchowensis]
MPSGVLLKLNFGLRRAIVGRNSIPLVSKTAQFSSRRSLSTSSMAASSSKAVFGDVHIDDMIAACGNGLEFSKPSGVFFSDRTRSSCIKASVKMRNRELPNSRLVYLGPLLKNLYSSSSVCFSAGAAQDVSLDGNSREEQLEDSTMVSGQNLKLLSGSCYLPHPDKEETGGEDAHFICEDEQAIGVADGVGGWADVGVNAGEFSRELMSHSVSAIQEEPNGSIDPARVLEKAHAKTKAQGSSTACIITLKSEGIHAINLGDSGFMVVRDGCTIFQSPVQQHGFNFTYQLESGNGGDLPSSGQVFTIPVAPGDIIIAGTDGLFDNLYNNETRLGPEATAQKIAALARQRALDRNRQTPFSSAAQDAGYRYYGGKLDDITVVVSYITNYANM